jgi:hypothetical protein
LYFSSNKKKISGRESHLAAGCRNIPRANAASAILALPPILFGARCTMPKLTAGLRYVYAFQPNANFLFVCLGQVRFLVEQGIDHLVSLSPEKIPPHYAFPNLKHTLIPVEDFTGPTIAEIQKFIEITDEARREGEAVGVHCAEGTSRSSFHCFHLYFFEQ